MRILIACEFSGIVRDAFIKRGHKAISCDILPTESPGPHYQGDVFYIINDGFDMMIAHPPCTYLSNCGNKWFGEKYKNRFPNRERDRDMAVDFFIRLAEAPIAKICMENPVGALSTRYKKPTQIIQPYNFGHDVRKATCLWLKGLEPLNSTKIVSPNIKTNNNGKTASVFHDKCLALPQAERSKARSRTFTGIAEAMAEQWG